MSDQDRSDDRSRKQHRFEVDPLAVDGNGSATTIKGCSSISCPMRATPSIAIPKLLAMKEKYCPTNATHNSATHACAGIAAASAGHRKKVETERHREIKDGCAK